MLLNTLVLNQTKVVERIRFESIRYLLKIVFGFKKVLLSQLETLIWIKRMFVKGCIFWIKAK